jgi:hypothetical protein
VIAASSLLLVRVPVVVFAIFVPSLGLKPALASDNVPDMSGEYEFLSAENTLAILEEEGKLKGYIDVAQGEDESDAVLTFQIMQGMRQGDRVQFRTAKIHERSYRFSGTVERGRGRTERDADFLRLVGDLETVRVDSATGQEQADKRYEIFKWKPKAAQGKE